MVEEGHPEKQVIIGGWKTDELTGTTFAQPPTGSLDPLSPRVAKVALTRNNLNPRTSEMPSSYQTLCNATGMGKHFFRENHPSTLTKTYSEHLTQLIANGKLKPGILPDGREIHQIPYHRTHSDLTYRDLREFLRKSGGEQEGREFGAAMGSQIRGKSLNTKLPARVGALVKSLKAAPNYDAQGKVPFHELESHYVYPSTTVAQAADIAAQAAVVHKASQPISGPAGKISEKASKSSTTIFDPTKE